MTIALFALLGAKVFKSVSFKPKVMKQRVRIEVNSKPGHSDPEGETTARMLKELGYNVESVKVGKVYHVLLDARNRSKASEEAREMCKRLLANPTKDNFTIAIEEER